MRCRTESTYDSKSSLIYESDSSAGTTTTYAYDEAGRTLQSADTFTTPGTIEATSYDATDNLLIISTQDPLGQSTTYLYDASTQALTGSL